MERRLAAILAADLVGYSRQMGADEGGTMVRLLAIRSQVIEPLLAEHSGRLFKTTGDGFLAEFASAVHAVTCASVCIPATCGWRGTTCSATA